MTTAATIIADARDILLTRGWTQGAAEGPNGAVCLQQALLVASQRAMGEANENRLGAPMVFLPYRNTVVPLAFVTATQIFNELLGTAIPPWNDHPGTTFRDVLDLLARAEARAKKEAMIRYEPTQPLVPLLPPVVWKMAYVPPPVMPAKHEEEKEEELALV